MDQRSVSKRIERGVMVMKNGKAWGVSYEDGHFTSYGWISAAEAPIHDPRFCTSTTSVTYAGSHYIKELITADLVHVERVTEVFVRAATAVQNEPSVNE